MTHANKKSRGSFPRSLPGVVMAATFATAAPWPAQDMAFLQTLTREIVDSSRIQPGERVGTSPVNSSGFTLIKPGGGPSYPSFWIRDFAMSLESGFITPAEMQNHLTLVAQKQNGAAPRNLANGLIIPPHAIPDHIRFDTGAVFFPGTYSSGGNQGGGAYGRLPPVDDHYEFVHIAWCLFKSTAATGFLQDTVKGMPMLERLDSAFAAPRTDALTGLSMTDATLRAVGFGFCDVVVLTGRMLFPSLLRYRAAGQLAELHQALGNTARAQAYLNIQRVIAMNVVPTFSEPARIKGWLKAATGVGQQPDVWGTLYALHLGLLAFDSTQGASADTLIGTVIDAVRRNTIHYQGAVRHVPTDMNFSATSAWEQAGAAMNTYQNGAYWHTPTGWLIEAVQRRDSTLALQLFSGYIGHLRANDFRLGGSPQAPWECFFGTTYTQNGLYMTSVTLPWAVLSRPSIPTALNPLSKSEQKKNLFRANMVPGMTTFRIFGKGAYALTAYGPHGSVAWQVHGSGESRHVWQPATGGAYLVRLTGKNGTQHKKIVVMR